MSDPRLDKDFTRRAIAWEVRYGDQYAVEVEDHFFPGVRSEDVEEAMDEYYGRYGSVQEDE